MLVRYTKQAGTCVIIIIIIIILCTSFHFHKCSVAVALFKLLRGIAFSGGISLLCKERDLNQTPPTVLLGAC